MTWFEISNSGHKLIEFQAWCWLSFYWVLHKGVDQIYRLGSSFQKGYSTQHKLLQGSISRIWNGWTPDKIYPISWKQWKRRKREGNLWKSEKRSVVMEIRWAEWPRRKVCRTMKNLGYCFDSLSTRPPPLPSLLANITIFYFHKRAITANWIAYSLVFRFCSSLAKLLFEINLMTLENRITPPLQYFHPCFDSAAGAGSGMKLVMRGNISSCE